MLVLWNLIALNLGWLASVLGAAWGYPWTGPAAIAVLAAIHMRLMPNRGPELILLVGALGLGYVADSLLVLTGVMTFPPDAAIGKPSTVWMALLWVNFAMTLHVSLRWLSRRYALTALLGAVGGPWAYYGGAAMGAVTWPNGAVIGLAAVAVEWAVAAPLLVALADRTAAVSLADNSAIAWQEAP